MHPERMCRPQVVCNEQNNSVTILALQRADAGRLVVISGACTDIIQKTAAAVTAACSIRRTEPTQDGVGCLYGSPMQSRYWPRYPP